MQVSMLKTRGHVCHKAQRSGIFQGCTLSPQLFIITITLLMDDAVPNLDAPSLAACHRGDLADMVYTDDTLLLASSDGHLQELLLNNC